MATEDFDDIKFHRIQHMQRSEQLGPVDDMPSLQYKKLVTGKKKALINTMIKCQKPSWSPFSVSFPPRRHHGIAGSVNILTRERSTVLHSEL